MPKFITPKQAVGMEIESVIYIDEWNSKPVLKFANGDLLGFSAVSRWDDPPEVKIMELEDLDEEERVQLGFWTQEEFMARKQEREERAEASRREMRRRSYLELQKEFGE